MSQLKALFEKRPSVSDIRKAFLDVNEVVHGESFFSKGVKTPDGKNISRTDLQIEIASEDKIVLWKPRGGQFYLMPNFVAASIQERLGEKDEFKITGELTTKKNLSELITGKRAGMQLSVAGKSSVVLIEKNTVFLLLDKLELKELKAKRKQEKYEQDKKFFERMAEFAVEAGREVKIKRTDKKIKLKIAGRNLEL